MRSIVTLLESRSVAAANRIANELYLGAQLLATMSHRGRPGRSAGTREMVFPRGGYILTYEVVLDGVFILDIRHGSQDVPRS